MLVAFRCDADTNMGSGHVRRCLTLADALRDAGAQCCFLSRPAPGALLEAIAACGHLVHALDGQATKAGAKASAGGPGETRYPQWLPGGWEADAEACIPALSRQRADWLVVDHYSLDRRWEARMRVATSRILVIDDLADRAHDCDVLVDANYGRSPDDYRSLVPPACEVLAGSRHVLLRPEFARERAGIRPGRALGRPRRVLINMGGVDPPNASGEALSVLRSLPTDAGLEATVVLGPGAPWIEDVRRLVDDCAFKAQLLVNAPDMAALMAASEFAIGAGGTGVYERLYLRLPSLVRPIAENQRQHLANMAAAGLFTLYEDAESLRAQVLNVLERGAPVPPDVVANGVPGLCRLMTAEGLLLLPPSPRDIRRTFRWLQDPGLRDSFLMKERPQRRRHFGHWRSLLSDPSQRVFAIHAEGRHVGNAGLREFDAGRKEAELWLYLGDGADRGRGLGRRSLAAIEQVMRSNLGLQRSMLHVDAANQAACALYSAAGYRVVPGRQSDAGFGPGVQRMEKAL